MALISLSVFDAIDEVNSKDIVTNADTANLVLPRHLMAVKIIRRERTL